MALLKWILAAILVIAISLMKKAASVPNTNEVDTRCGPLSDSTDYELAAQFVRRKLVQNTGRRGGSYYRSKRVKVEGTWRRCYGHATCSRTLPIQDCVDCLLAASVVVVHTCPVTSSAWTRLVDCYIRFSSNRFYEGCKISSFESYLSRYLAIISHPCQYDSCFVAPQNESEDGKGIVPSRDMPTLSFVFLIELFTRQLFRVLD
ncbi:hypothetical protein MLD38_028025 [Melastoma candidum]|uniref:Uncharacterized protein n=1 Tax=Melastoma candidum TaxID=119954 RepID=A0ACB9N1Z4_9MYRT|nr:hypothetical protein MLD38_028025 [Melastoma candidum]